MMNECKNEAATPILAQMKSAIQQGGEKGYTSVTDVDKNIVDLVHIMETDQGEDDTNFTADSLRVNKAIEIEDGIILGMKKDRQVQMDLIDALNKERSKIENIYTTDRNAYLDRVAKQAQLKLTLESLVEQCRVGLLENPLVPGAANTEIQSVLAQVKEIGRGHPVEALVQLTKLFTKNDASNIIDRFHSLLEAVEASQKIDSDKEDYNLNLYVTLTSNIDNVLIPNADARIFKINKDIKIHRTAIKLLTKELNKITDLYLYRRKERTEAIDYSNLASAKLHAELQDLEINEVNVRGK